MVTGDPDDPSTLVSAFEGAHAIFSITDFWHPFYDPVNQEILRPGQTMNEFCYDLEVQFSKNGAGAAAKVQTLERFLFSALSSAKKWSKGRYTLVYHFDSEAAAVGYIKNFCRSWLRNCQSCNAVSMPRTGKALRYFFHRK